LQPRTKASALEKRAYGTGNSFQSVQPRTNVSARGKRASAEPPSQAVGAVYNRAPGPARVESAPTQNHRLN